MWCIELIITTNFWDYNFLLKFMFSEHPIKIQQPSEEIYLPPGKDSNNLPKDGKKTCVINLYLYNKYLCS